jgi:hypothetical protein
VRVRAGRSFARTQRQPEVGDDDVRRPLRLGHEHHVVALEVAVHDARLMGRVESSRHLHHEGTGRAGRQRSSVQPARQRLARQELHRGERDRRSRRGRLVVEEIENPAAVGMGHLPRQKRLALEPRDGALILGDLRSDRLERDVLVQLQILGLAQLTHAAAGDEADDTEAIGDDLALGEVGAWGRGY